MPGAEVAAMTASLACLHSAWAHSMGPARNQGMVGWWGALLLRLLLFLTALVSRAWWAATRVCREVGR